MSLEFPGINSLQIQVTTKDVFIGKANVTLSFDWKNSDDRAKLYL